MGFGSRGTHSCCEQKLLYHTKIEKANLSKDCIDLIKNLLQVEHSKRLKTIEIFSHPWIKNDLSDCKVLNEDYIKEFTKRKRELEKREEAEKIENEDESF